VMFDTAIREHACVDGHVSKEPSWWAHDAQGIELCRVCEFCQHEKMKRYRPEILPDYEKNDGYDQHDVNEPIDGDSF